MTLTDVTSVNQGASLVRAKILKPLCQPFALADTTLSLTPRAGMAMFPEDGGDPRALLHRSELALKRATTLGEAFAVYAPVLNDRVAERLHTETKLRQAIDAREFVLHYQVKIDLNNNTVSGAEALIRWQDPETGLVPPDRFIPILEETGMIGEVGNWVIQQLLTDYICLRQQRGKAPRLALNVSAIQLRNPGFVGEIEAALASYAADGGTCDIEITESVLMENVQANIDKLQRLRDLGLSIAVDDFGTGYSSLAYIARLPISSLKIDKTFVDRIATHATDRAIAEAIITLAHALNLKAIAEGVETEVQVSTLRELGCDEAQGYYFSRPVPLNEFERLI